MEISKFDTEKSFDYENGFYLTSLPFRMGNILSHYELYKKIIDLPGDVIELGVFRGGSLIQFATFRELLENENSRKIVGFDIFGEFPNDNEKTIESDNKFIKNWNQNINEYLVTKDDLYKSLEHKGIRNVELVEGDILKTIDEYLKSHPYTKISLLHVDTDVYEPAKRGLEKLFDRVVRGGLIIFDDYGTVEGETLAIDEFFKDKPEYQIKKFPFSHCKPSFVVKIS